MYFVYNVLLIEGSWWLVLLSDSCLQPSGWTIALCKTPSTKTKEKSRIVKSVIIRISKTPSFYSSTTTISAHTLQLKHVYFPWNKSWKKLWDGFTFMWKHCSLVARPYLNKKKKYSDMLCSLWKTDCNEPIYCFNSDSNYSKHPRCSLTLNENTFSFIIRFINILQATEHNKGKIK